MNQSGTVTQVASFLEHSANGHKELLHSTDDLYSCFFTVILTPTNFVRTLMMLC